jgi:hypothetical protein
LYQALALAERDAPAQNQGAFIPAGNAFDAMSAVGKVLERASNSIRIVDPYMDCKVLTDFAVLAKEGVLIQLLTDQGTHKPSFQPAVDNWKIQYCSSRPLEARLAPPRTLHDRVMFIDGSDAWTLTQSLNAFATRSPASIVRVDADTAALKIAAYDDLWNTASPV